MNGVQKLFYLPEPHTDFIYAVISEELGLVGATAVILCFSIITWRGMRAALRAPDSFGAFLAVGLTTMIAVQALVNISVVLGLMPTKGIPLPFVSMGGSSLLVNLVGMGILLNVSQHASVRGKGDGSIFTRGLWMFWSIFVSSGSDGMDSERDPSPFPVVIAGGGTGGHLYPGIAVAREVLARQPAATISFAGTAKGSRRESCRAKGSPSI